MNNQNKDNLSLDELEKITGGVQFRYKAQEEQLMRISCPFCADIIEVNVQLSSVKCPSCGKTITMAG